MKIKIISIASEQPITIQAFAEIHDLTMEVREGDHCNRRDKVYSANFEQGEIKENIESKLMAGTIGQGSTMELAINDYASKISGKIIVVNAYSRARKQIQVPKLKFNEFNPVPQPS